MCLIAVAEQGKASIPAANLEYAANRNKDGWGIMYPQDGRVIVQRANNGFDAFKAAWEAVPADIPCAVHFRMATSGEKDDKNCHPFPVLTKERHGSDLYMMHNGVLSDFKGNAKRSDTREFVEDVLTPMLAKHPRFIRTAAFRKLMGAVLGYNNKLVFLEGCGKWHIFHAEQGHRDEACHVWYSNTYSLPPAPSATKFDYPYSDYQGYYGRGSSTTTVWQGGRPGMMLDGVWTPYGYADSGESRGTWNPEAEGFRKATGGVWRKFKRQVGEWWEDTLGQWHHNQEGDTKGKSPAEQWADACAAHDADPNKKAATPSNVVTYDELRARRMSDANAAFRGQGTLALPAPDASATDDDYQTRHDVAEAMARDADPPEYSIAERLAQGEQEADERQNLGDALSEADQREVLQAQAESAGLEPVTENLMRWGRSEVMALSARELLNSIVSDPDGASDFLLDLMGVPDDGGDFLGQAIFEQVCDDPDKACDCILSMLGRSDGAFDLPPGWQG